MKCHVRGVPKNGFRHFQTRASWNKYFLLLSVFNVWSLVVFLVFGSAEPQPWAEPAIALYANRPHWPQPVDADSDRSNGRGWSYGAGLETTSAPFEEGVPSNGGAVCPRAATPACGPTGESWADR